MQRREVLSTYKVKYTGNWAFLITPSRRSSLMKYLNMMSNGNILYHNHLYDSGGRIKREQGNELISEDDLLDGKVCMPLVFKCLGLIICLSN